MDIQKITHETYRMSVFITLVLSAMIVALASIAGRGIINLKGSLFNGNDLRPIAAILAVEREAQAQGKTVKNVRVLDKRKDALPNERHAYVELSGESDHRWYFVSFLFKQDRWTVQSMEKLHGDPPSAHPS